MTTTLNSAGRNAMATASKRAPMCSANTEIRWHACRDTADLLSQWKLPISDNARGPHCKCLKNINMAMINLWSHASNMLASRMSNKFILICPGPNLQDLTSPCEHAPTCPGPAKQWAPAAISGARQSPGWRPRRRGRGPPTAAAH